MFEGTSSHARSQMGLPLFYISEDKIDKLRGSTTISGPDAKHLVKSLRARLGDSVSVCDSKGTIYQARIDSATPDLVTLSIVASRYTPPERPQVVVFQALSKSAAMDEAVARSAESGAARFVPFASRRSPFDSMRKSASRVERWRAIANESSKLARRPYPLDVREPSAVLDESLLQTVGECIVLWEGEQHRSLMKALSVEPPRSIGIIVGPEGGFEPVEIDTMRSLGARPASMGEINLRAQSAASYASIILRYHYGMLVPEGQSDE